MKVRTDMEHMSALGKLSKLFKRCRRSRCAGKDGQSLGPDGKKQRQDLCFNVDRESREDSQVVAWREVLQQSVC